MPMNLKPVVKPSEVFHYLSSVLLLLILLVFSAIQLKTLFIERLDPDEALYSWYALKISVSPSFLFSKEIIQFHPPLFSLLLAGAYSIFSSDIAYRCAIC